MLKKEQSNSMNFVFLIAAFFIIAIMSNLAFAVTNEQDQLADEQIVDEQAVDEQADANGAETSGLEANAAIVTSGPDCPDCVGNNGSVDSSQNSNGISAGLTAPTLNANINGGYVANGTGMRNRGWGTILINGIPAGSTTYKAYLYWSIIGGSIVTPPASYAAGKINGVAIVGTKIGTSTNPCWGGGNIFVYRADVTSKVPAGSLGNKPYHLTDFASGNVWGDIPGIGALPYMEGASLIVVYKNAKYPMTNIQIKDGAQTLISTISTTSFTIAPASSLPVAKTTFVVADGQTFAETYVRFNGFDMPTNFLDGIDRQNGNDFAGGNLQDTNTAYVKVRPGSTSASAQIASGADCLTWIAQVFSISDGNLDSDGDALKNSWELFGYDYNNDGIIDVNLPANGANPFHKDIFVEADYMAAGPGETKSHMPDPKVVATSINTFLNAPSANNPDGLGGINIHVEIGNAVPHDADLNPVWAQFDAIKLANFPVAKWDTHHYALFAHMYSGGTSSGLSRGIPASDFIVSLGGWSTNPGTPDQQTGTFIHELGHNLNLKHGGNDHVNYKPNYLSIMNYWFQMSGVYRNGAWGNFDYQRTNPYNLNEAALNEASGIGAPSAGYRTQFTSPGCVPRTSTTNMPIDWNWNGAITSPVAVDINCDGSLNLLGSQNNWLNIVYNGGSVGGISEAGVKAQAMSADAMPTELTEQEFKKMNK